jgi:DNA polymerase-3 subunit alpha
VRELEYQREKNRKKKLYLKLHSTDRKAVQHVELLLTMFPGDEQIILYFEDTKKRMAAPCIVHEALVAELQELYGEDRVAIK